METFSLQIFSWINWNFSEEGTEKKIFWFFNRETKVEIKISTQNHFLSHCGPHHASVSGEKGTAAIALMSVSHDYKAVAVQMVLWDTVA